jgi:hypothetical protein
MTRVTHEGMATARWPRQLAGRLAPLMALLLLSGASVAWALPSGVIHHWPGENNANDVVGGQNGTLEPAVNGTTFATGKVGDAFSFDGVDDTVGVPDTASQFGIVGNNAFTIDLWVNFSSIKAGGHGSIPNVFIGQDEGSGATDKWMFFYSSSGLGFHINNPGVGSDFLLRPFTATVGQWYNFAISRNGAGLYQFYVNGAPLGSSISQPALTLPDPAAPLRFGDADEPISLNFHGLLDEVQIYNRALTASEIEGLATVPEPASLLLLGVGLAAVGVTGTRRGRTRRE